MKKLLSVFALSFILNLMAFSTNYYIRTDGNDGNDGQLNTASRAWKSIAAKAGILNPGDVLWIADGTYYEGEIKIENKNGSDANRIVIKAINTKGAKISSQSSWNAISINNCTGVTIEGLEVFFPAGSTNTEYGIFASESNFVTIKNNTVNNAGLSGIQPNMSDNVLVEGNYVYENASRSSYNGSGISVYHPKVKSASPSGFGIIIRNNISHSNNCTIPDANGNVTDGNGIIIDDFKNDQGGGQTGGYTKGALVENNLCYNNGGRGIHIFSSDNATVRNNTVWHNCYTLNSKNIYAGDLSVDGGVNCKVLNNITVVNAAYTTYGCALKVNYDGGTTKLNNNLVVGPSAIQFQTYNSSTTLTGGGNSGNVLNTSDTYPKFINPNTNGSVANFKLQSTSPAINAGTNTNAATVDLDWLARPQGGTTDIGCYESASGGSDTQAPTTPGNLNASNITQTSCTLTWTASTDNVGVTKYHIYRNGAWIAETTASTLTYNVTGLTANTTYTFGIQAQDAANNYSASATKSVKTISINLLTNPGAESGTTGWTGKNCTLTAITTQKHAGANGFSAASRAGAYAGPSQNILSALNSNGTGTYYCEAWVKMASGTANAKITVYLKYNNTDYYVSLTSAAVNATGWTKVSGTLNLSWSATLQTALWYIETDAGTTTMYVDDCWLNKGTTKSAQIATNINTESTNSFKIYPNPISNQNLTITFSENELGKTKNLSIFNSEGKRVFIKLTSDSELQIDAALLKRGIYIVNVNCENKKMSQKLLVQ